MTSPTLLRVSRTDDESCLLVHVAPTSSVHQFDLTLKATEGERAFETKLQEAKISSYKHKNYTGTEDELKAIFKHLFLKSPVTDVKLIEGLELTASAEGDRFILRIRKSYGRVKQPVASFPIPEEEVEIPIFDWAAESCVALDLANEQLQKQQFQMDDQDKMIESLTTRLNSLTTLKKEHEELLLVKFKELLNAKKLKIRELGRALGATNAIQKDKGSEEPVTALPSKDKRKRRVAPSPSLEPEPAPTKGRRKAAPKATAGPVRKRKLVPPPSDSEDDDFLAAKAPEATIMPPVAAPVEDDDTTIEDEDEPQLSDRQDSEDEDEMPPVRKPIEFNSTRAVPALFKEPSAGYNDDDTDDEL